MQQLRVRGALSERLAVAQELPSSQLKGRLSYVLSEKYGPFLRRIQAQYRPGTGPKTFGYLRVTCTMITDRINFKMQITGREDDEIVAAVVTASRAMIAIAVQSLSGLAEDITIAQYRTLVVLASRGPQKLADLAKQLGVTPPTAGRMSDRLVRRGLVSRHRGEDDRRVVRIAITPVGRDVVGEATQYRLAIIAEVLSGVPADRRGEIAAALRDFAAAVGEIPDDQWPPGPVEAAGKV